MIFYSQTICFCSGYVELPDGKVLSGSEWGNMLLWDGDLIKCELSSTENKNCHKGQIQEIFLDEGELITAGADGSVKVKIYGFLVIFTTPICP